LGGAAVRVLEIERRGLLTVSKNEALELTSKMQMQNRREAARIVELRAYLASLPDDPGVSGIDCRFCRLEFRSVAKRDEHVYHQHGGPVPEHWLEAERRAQ
jgi:hypothetical protein